MSSLLIKTFIYRIIQEKKQRLFSDQIFGCITFTWAGKNTFIKTIQMFGSDKWKEKMFQTPTFQTIEHLRETVIHGMSLQFLVPPMRSFQSTIREARAAERSIQVLNLDRLDKLKIDNLY